ncbi:unnamed protein product [Musa acuminata subsp. malaccensis]|uniref:(wild Malaysian banana) hypothetical protein n=1 Tax=Musa acuminata subsp. malaccensis TaxID=214687 RepID=A0A804IGE7_MUSAM|nr:unnamed protein product [Musa acuminata subsp. malaccensis]
MLGFRGCRLGISYPELTKMQARAIFEAAISMSNQGVKVLPEIMVPLTGTPQEFEHQVSLIRTVAQQVFTEMGTSISYKVGTMIEVPRAALVADEAEFFSFGTNDLTQMTFGYSRDDVRKFLPIYLSKGILQNDPFEVLDQKGVGQLIKIAAERGRRARPDLKVSGIYVRSCSTEEEVLVGCMVLELKAKLTSQQCLFEFTQHRGGGLSRMYGARAEG